MNVAVLVSAAMCCYAPQHPAFPRVPNKATRPELKMPAASDGSDGVRSLGLGDRLAEHEKYMLELDEWEEEFTDGLLKSLRRSLPILKSKPQTPKILECIRKTEDLIRKLDGQKRSQQERQPKLQEVPESKPLSQPSDAVPKRVY